MFHAIDLIMAPFQMYRPNLGEMRYLIPFFKCRNNNPSYPIILRMFTSHHVKTNKNSVLLGGIMGSPHLFKLHLQYALQNKNATSRMLWFINSRPYRTQKETLFFN